jgi:DNA-binding CsgD family transcriptional regulator
MLQSVNLSHRTSAAAVMSPAGPVVQQPLLCRAPVYGRGDRVVVDAELRVPREREPRISIPADLSLTGRQRVVLMLVEAGYTTERIARFMGLRNPRSAEQLIARARIAYGRLIDFYAQRLGEGDEQMPLPGGRDARSKLRG